MIRSPSLRAALEAAAGPIAPALALVLLLAVPSPSTATEPEPPILEKYAQYVAPISVHWNDVPQSSVVEFFSYNCNYCESARNFVDHFLLYKPDSLEFVHFHVSSSDNVAWQASQVAFAAATLAGIEEQVHDQLFDRNALQGDVFRSPEEVRVYFEQLEDGAAAAELVGSKEVAEMRAGISRKIKEAEITRVPTFIVNQRYRVNWGTEMSVEEFTDLLLAVASLPPHSAAAGIEPGGDF